MTSSRKDPFEQFAISVAGTEHDSLAARLAFAVAEEIITDAQRTMLLTRWRDWGALTMDESCWRSQDQARQIREQQGWLT